MLNAITKLGSPCPNCDATPCTKAPLEHLKNSLHRYGALVLKPMSSIVSTEGTMASARH